jgi:UDP-GlcNAc:undecaprenyl-phosphate GlcNAc-1-phosphate transferase
MSITNIILIGLAAFLGAYVVTPWAREVSKKCGMVDVPNDRKMHKSPVPYGGGLAIFAGFLLGFLILGKLDAKLTGFIIGAFIIVILGIIDDMKGLNAGPKIVFQSLAALIAIYFGIKIDMGLVLRGHVASLEMLSIPLTFLWIVGITNAINLIDGLDGLAAGVVTISAFTLGAVGFVNGQETVATLSIILGAASLGFLPHNFRTKIFMGDTGSMFLGYSLATLSILGAVKLAAAFSLFIPVVVLAIPIFDTLFAIIRRIVSGQPISHGDKKHLHHRLLEMGFSAKETVIFIYGLSLIFGGLGVLSSMVVPRVAYYIFVAALAIVIMIGAAIVALHQKNIKEGEE